MYKIARDDFKADKSMSHLAHTCLMGSLCYLLTDPSRRELGLQLESLAQVMSTVNEVRFGLLLYYIYCTYHLHIYMSMYK